VGTVLMLAVALGLAAYTAVTMLPRYSPRAGMIRRLGHLPVGPLRADTGLAVRLRQVPVTRRLPPQRFRLLQAGLAGGAAALILAPWSLFHLAPDWGALALYPPLLWAAPEVWLWLQARRRHALLTRAYPDLLAHLTTQTRAGAGTFQAFASCPPVLREPLRDEVEELIADLRVAPFPAALQRFADRCGTPETRAFAQSIIYQQSLGIALPEALAAEEAHAVAMARQQVRQRIQASAVAMASVTVVLLLNGLLVYFTPVLFDLMGLIER